MTATHRTLVEQVADHWCWALQRIADQSIVAEGEAREQADAIEAATEAGHAAGLAVTRWDESRPSAEMR